METEQISEMVEQTMSENIGELAGAMAKAQGEMRGAVKDADNPFFKSKYADLAAVLDACREALSKNQIAVFQTTEPDSEGIIVVTTLAHSSGQWLRGKLRVRPQKNDPQAIGSAITYARRYSLAAIAGVAQVDDDAESAMGRSGQQKGQVSGDNVDLDKIAQIVVKARAIIDNEDPDMVETPKQAKALYQPLKSDERMAFQAMMKDIKYGKKMAWSIFHEYLQIAAKEAA